MTWVLKDKKEFLSRWEERTMCAISQIHSGFQSDSVWLGCGGQMKSERNRGWRGRINWTTVGLLTLLKSFNFILWFFCLGHYRIWYVITKNGMKENETKNWGWESNSCITAIFETVNLNLASFTLESLYFSVLKILSSFLCYFWKWKTFSNGNMY